MNEQQLKKLLVEYLLRKGHFVWVNNSGFVKRFYMSKQGVESSHVLRSGIKGSSDIIGIEKITGRFIAIEVKAGKNITSTEQDIFLENINRRNGLAIVAYSLEDVQKYL